MKSGYPPPGGVVALHPLLASPPPLFVGLPWLPLVRRRACHRTPGTHGTRPRSRAACRRPSALRVPAAKHDKGAQVAVSVTTAGATHAPAHKPATLVVSWLVAQLAWLSVGAIVPPPGRRFLSDGGARARPHTRTMSNPPVVSWERHGRTAARTSLWWTRCAGSRSMRPTSGAFSTSNSEWTSLPGATTFTPCVTGKHLALRVKWGATCRCRSHLFCQSFP